MVMSAEEDLLTGDPLGFEAETSEIDPFDRCAATLGSVLDECMAALLRGVRTGQARSLLEQGFSSTALELEHWQHD
jgi:hypothetical protein